MAKVLFAEDNLEFAESMSQFLSANGYTVEHTSDGHDALRFLQDFGYDVAILDWELPGLSGVELCSRIRKAGNLIPVIMLTGKAEAIDTVQGIDAGADDYLIKPVDPIVVLAKLKAILRRTENRSTNILGTQGVELDPDTHCVSIDGEAVSLLPKEFAVLEFFLRNRDRLFSPDEVISHVWAADDEVSVESVRTCMFRLRKKLDKFQKANLIENVYGRGYILRS